MNPKTAEYLTSKGIINPIRVECKNLLKLFEGKSVSYTIDPHYIWTSRRERIYNKLKTRNKIPEIIRPAYDFFRFRLSEEI